MTCGAYHRDRGVVVLQHPAGRQWSRAFCFKTLISGVVVFAGVAGGIYTGTSLISGSDRELSPVKLKNDSLLDPGDSFPPYELTIQPSRQQTSVRQLALGKPTILAFVSPDCDPCITLAAVWKKRIAGVLRDDIQLILIFGENEFEYGDDYGGVFDIPEALVCCADHVAQRAKTGIYSKPTLVALDEEGVIVWVSSGYSSKIDGDFINEYL